MGVLRIWSPTPASWRHFLKTVRLSKPQPTRAGCSPSLQTFLMTSYRLKGEAGVILEPYKSGRALVARSIAILIITYAFSALSHAEPVSTAFSLQGRLELNNRLAEGFYDFEVGLYETQEGSVDLDVVLLPGIKLLQGVFSLELDFVNAPFTDGEQYWLELRVRESATAQDFTTLNPRQKIGAAPYAIHAEVVAVGSVTSAAIADGSIASTDIAPEAIGLDQIDVGAVQARISQACPEGSSIRAVAADGTVTCETDDVGDAGGVAWVLSGNAGTSAASDFLGTTDEQPLVLKVNGKTMFTLSDEASGFNSPNIIGGAAVVENSVVGATVFGGQVGDVNSRGLAHAPNTVSQSSTTISGGVGHTISGFAGVISGGGGNLVQGTYGTVGGGNVNQVNDDYATVGGGVGNLVNAEYASIAGGAINNVDGERATIGGGQANRADAVNAVVGGGFANLNNGISSTIGGGSSNVITRNQATIAGGDRNEAQGDWASVGGGLTNRALGQASVIGGGDSNTAADAWSMVGGGRDNSALGPYSLVSGGQENSAHGAGSAVPGGSKNLAGGDYSFAAGRNATVRNAEQAGEADSEGVCNVTAGTCGDEGSFVWAGADTTPFESTGPNQFLVHASGGFGVSETAPLARAHIQRTDLALDSNALLNEDLIVEDGDAVLGLYSDNAGAWASAISLGHLNNADELAAKWSIAQRTNSAGPIQTSALAFIFGTDASYADNDTRMALTTNGFLALNRGSATHPIHVGTSGSNGNGAHLTAGGTWTNGSSRLFKEVVDNIDPQSILASVLSLPIARWRYNNSNEGQHLGPMAEDFAIAFGLGTSPQHIATVDADGVALAAIQGLNQKLEADKDALEASNTRLRARILELEKSMRALAQKLDSINAEARQ